MLGGAQHRALIDERDFGDAFAEIVARRAAAPARVALRRAALALSPRASARRARSACRRRATNGFAAGASAGSVAEQRTGIMQAAEREERIDAILERD